MGYAKAQRCMVRTISAHGNERQLGAIHEAIRPPISSTPYAVASNVLSLLFSLLFNKSSSGLYKKIGGIYTNNTVILNVFFPPTQRPKWEGENTTTLETRDEFSVPVTLSRDWLTSLVTLTKTHTFWNPVPYTVKKQVIFPIYSYFVVMIKWYIWMHPQPGKCHINSKHSYKM